MADRRRRSPEGSRRGSGRKDRYPYDEPQSSQIQQQQQYPPPPQSQYPLPPQQQNQYNPTQYSNQYPPQPLPGQFPLSPQQNQYPPQPLPNQYPIPPAMAQPNARTRSPEIYSSSSGSSSSSSYLDISRSFPPKRSGFRTFFTAPSESRRLRKRRSSRSMRHSNSSKESVGDLAYGTGYIKKEKVRKVRSRKGKDIDRQGDRYNQRERENNERYKERDRVGGSNAERSHGSVGGSGAGSRAPTTHQSSGVGDTAAILTIGAGLAKLAHDQNKLDMRSGGRPGPGAARGSYGGQYATSTSRGIPQSRVSHGPDEDGWESASDGESESSADSNLAFGNESTVGFWPWGKKEHKPESRKNTVVDPRLFGRQNSLRGIITAPVGFENNVSWTSTTNFGPQNFIPSERPETPGYANPSYPASTGGSQVSLQQLFPMTTSDPYNVEAVKAGSSVSAKTEFYNPLPRPDQEIQNPDRGVYSSSSRPGPESYGPALRSERDTYNPSSRPGPEIYSSSRPDTVTIQHPTPRTPVSQNVYEQGYTARSDSGGILKKRDSYKESPTNKGASIAGLALAGVAGVVGASVIADRRDDRKDKEKRREDERREEERVRLRDEEKREEERRSRRDAERKDEERIKRREAERKEEERIKRRDEERREEERLRRKEDERREEDRLRRKEEERKEAERLKRREKEIPKASPKSKDKEKRKSASRTTSQNGDDDIHRDKKSHKKRDETREEREKRRESRSDDKQSNRGQEFYEPRRTRSEVAAPQTAIDPFQFQDRDIPIDFNQTTISAPLHGRTGSVPTVVTVDREPQFARNRSSSIKETPSYAFDPRTYPEYDDRDRGHRDRVSRDSQEEIGERIYRDVQDSTAPLVGGAIAAGAVVVAAEALRKSGSEQRRKERAEMKSEYEDTNYKRREEPAPNPERDLIQEDADRAYREVVMARKIASQVIRSRETSPERSVVHKYDHKDAEEIIRIETPPEMKEHRHAKGLYDAPNADFQPDYILRDPRELNSFSIAPVIFDRSNPDTAYLKRDPDADRPRPHLNLVHPTPSPSPHPEKQMTRSEPKPRESTKSKDPDPVTRTAASDVVAGYRGNDIASPTASTVSKGVTWGENETKHFEVESPHEPREEFITKEEVRSREAKSTDSGPSRAWGAIAAGIGATVGMVSSKSTDTPPAPTARQEGGRDDAPYEYRGVIVEPEPLTRDQRQPSPPSPGPKPPSPNFSQPYTQPYSQPPPQTYDQPTQSFSQPPTQAYSQPPAQYSQPPAQFSQSTSDRSAHIPGAFDDDLDFTAHVAAGLKDTGFDPELVIKDASFRRRNSPPGSNEPIYRAPFAETVTDLGTAPTGSRGEEGFIIGEVDRTPSEWRSVSPEGDVTTSKLSRKEQKKRDKEFQRQDSDITLVDPIPSREIAEEPDSYFEAPKLSKKEQKKRDKEAQKERSQVDDFAPLVETIAVAPLVLENAESYFETPKKSKKKSKKSSGWEDDVVESPSRNISVPIDAFDDVKTAEDEWDEPKKSKKKSKRDSERVDSPSRSIASPAMSVDLERSSSKKSKDKSRRKSEGYEPTPSEVSLPPSTPSETSQAGEFYDARSSRRATTDSGIYDSADRDDSRSVVSTSRTDDEPRRKKKHRSSTKDDFDDTRSIASAPAGDEEDRKKKKDKKGIFSGLFGSRSESGAREESPKRSKDDFDDSKKKSKKEKRRSVPDGGSLYGSVGASSVNDLSRSASNGHGNGSQYYDDDEGARSDGERRKTRSRAESTSSKKESFLGNPGTLGAGVGFVGIAAALAVQHHQQSKADDVDSREAIERARSLSPEKTLLQQQEQAFEPEFIRRQFRPSIDPQYGDLLPLPPSDPGTPNESLDDFPDLPESRPGTPETDRATKTPASILRKNFNDPPMKSPSHSAMPLTFRFGNRSIPSSPVPIRSPTLQISESGTQELPNFTRRSSRPSSWDNTKEYKPLYLVESARSSRNIRPGDMDEELPALPVSQATSRSSSQHGFDDRRDKDVEYTPLTPELSFADPLAIDTELASHISGDLLGSQQSTPKAGPPPDFGDFEGLAQKVESPTLPAHKTSRPSSPVADHKSPSSESDATKAIAAVGIASAIGYLASSPSHPIPKEDWTDDLPSVERHPSPIDSMSKDRSSYLLNSSPMTRMYDDLEPTSSRDLGSPLARKFVDDETLHIMEEKDSTPLLLESRELSDLTSGQEQASLLTLDAEEPSDEFAFIKSKKDKKKGDKKGKGLARSSILPESSSDAVSELPLSFAPAEVERVEFGLPKPSKKDKKKNKGLSRSSTQENLALSEPLADVLDETSLVESIVEPEKLEFETTKSKKGKKKGRDLSRSLTQENLALSVPIADNVTDDVLSMDAPIETESIEFDLPKTKKDKKKGKGLARSSTQDNLIISEPFANTLREFPATDAVIKPESTDTDPSKSENDKEAMGFSSSPSQENLSLSPSDMKENEQPSIHATAEPEGLESGLPKSKKDKKKDKKNASLSAWDEPTSEFGNDQPAVQKELVEDIPAISDTLPIEEPPISKSKKDKKGKGKNKSTPSWDEIVESSTQPQIQEITTESLESFEEIPVIVDANPAEEFLLPKSKKDKKGKSKSKSPPSWEEENVEANTELSIQESTTTQSQEIIDVQPIEDFAPPKSKKDKKKASKNKSLPTWEDGDVEASLQPEIEETISASRDIVDNEAPIVESESSAVFALPGSKKDKKKDKRKSKSISTWDEPGEKLSSEPDLQESREMSDIPTSFEMVLSEESALPFSKKDKKKDKKKSKSGSAWEEPAHDAVLEPHTQEIVSETTTESQVDQSTQKPDFLPDEAPITTDTTELNLPKSKKDKKKDKKKGKTSTSWEEAAGEEIMTSHTQIRDEATPFSEPASFDEFGLPNSEKDKKKDMKESQGWQEEPENVNAENSLDELTADEFHDASEGMITPVEGEIDVFSTPEARKEKEPRVFNWGDEDRSATPLQPVFTSTSENATQVPNYETSLAEPSREHSELTPLVTPVEADPVGAISVQNTKDDQNSETLDHEREDTTSRFLEPSLETPQDLSTSPERLGGEENDALSLSLGAAEPISDVTPPVRGLAENFNSVSEPTPFVDTQEPSPIPHDHLLETTTEMPSAVDDYSQLLGGDVESEFPASKSKKDKKKGKKSKYPEFEESENAQPSFETSGSSSRPSKDLPPTLIEAIPDSEFPTTKSKKDKKKGKNNKSLDFEELESETPAQLPQTSTETPSTSIDVIPDSEFPTRSKKDKKAKKSKNVVTWDSQDDSSLPQTPNEQTSESLGLVEEANTLVVEAKPLPTPTATETLDDFDLPKARKDKKKGKKGKSPLAWEDASESKTPQEPETPIATSSRDLSEQIPESLEAPENPILFEADAGDEFATPKTKKDKKKDKKRGILVPADDSTEISQDPNEPHPSSSRDLADNATIISSISTPADIDPTDEFAPLKSKKGGKKDKKKGKTTSSWDLEPEVPQENLPEETGRGIVNEDFAHVHAEEEPKSQIIESQNVGLLPLDSDKSQLLDSIPSDFEKSLEIPRASEMDPQIQSNTFPIEQLEILPEDLEPAFDDFSAPTSKKDKKKDKRKSKAIAWDDSVAESIALPESLPESSNEQTQEPASVEDFSMSSTKKGKKSKRKSSNFEALEDTSVPTTTDSRDLQTETALDVATQDDSVFTESKKDKKKKNKSSSQTFDDEPASVSDPPNEKLNRGTEIALATTGIAALGLGAAAVLSNESQELQTEVEKKDGLEAGYNNDQLSLARQLQEEFAAGNKKSKKDKKKRQSLPSTPEREPSRSRATEEPSSDHIRARSLSIGPAASRSVGSPASDLRRSLYSEDKLELAKQLQAEFSGSDKKSKKDKKKRHDLSRSITQDDEFFNQEPETPLVFSTPMEEPPTAPFEDIKPDGLEAGYKEDQLELARQLQSEFGSGSKKSKKDKKKLSRSATQDDLSLGPPTEDASEFVTPFEEPQPSLSDEATKRDGLEAGYQADQLSLARQLQAEFGKKTKKDKRGRSKSQTPLEVEPRTDYFGDAAPAFLDPFQPDTTARVMESPAVEPSPLRDGLAVGYNEDQLELARQLKEEFGSGAKKSKKDKKGKKGDSKLRSNIDDDFASDSLQRDIPESNLQTPNMDTPLAGEDSMQNPDDDSAPITKKSKKDKKGKNRGSLLRETTDDGFSSKPLSRDVEQQEIVETSQDIPSMEPVDDFSAITKKSKDKKGKKRASIVPDLEESSTFETIEVEKSEKATQVSETTSTEQPEEDFALIKKSKKDKKGKKREGIPPELSEEPGLLETTPKQVELFEQVELSQAPTESSEPTISEQLEEDFAIATKKSKKEKKGRKRESIVPDIPEETSIAASLPEEVEMSEQVETSQPAIDEQPEEEFAFTSKRSKKDKKGKKRESLTPALIEEDTISRGLPLDLTVADVRLPEESDELDTSQSQNLPADSFPIHTVEAGSDNEFLSIAKKSKKEKKGKKRDSIALAEQSIISSVPSRELEGSQPAASIPLPDDTIDIDSSPLDSSHPEPTSLEPIIDDDFAPITKKAKKDKKQQKSSSTLPVSEVEPSAELLVEKDTTLPTDSTPSESQVVAADPEDEFAFTSKKSKKDKKGKKKENLVQTPLEEQPSSDNFGDAVAALHSASFSQAKDLDTNLSEATTPAEEDSSSFFSAKKSKKDKKKSQSLAFEDSAVDQPEIEAGPSQFASNEESNADLTAANSAAEGGNEDFGFVSKKSKKDKKRKSLLRSSTFEDETTEQISEIDPGPVTKDLVDEPAVPDLSSSLPDAQNTFGFSDKKSKKDKKKRKSSLQDSIEEVPATLIQSEPELKKDDFQPNPTSTIDTELPDSSLPVISASPKIEPTTETSQEEIPEITFNEDFAFATKKSKRDKKKGKSSETDTIDNSGISTPLDPTPVPDTLRNLPLLSEDTEDLAISKDTGFSSGPPRDAQDDIASSSSAKKSKKDKKNKKSAQSTSFEEESTSSLLESTLPLGDSQANLPIDATAALHEEWGASSSKKSKKDKKKSGLSTPTEELPQPEVEKELGLPQPTHDLNLEFSADPSTIVSSELPEEKWDSLPSKKSKKEKKGKKSGISIPFNDFEDTTEAPESVPVETSISTPLENDKKPDDEWSSSFSTKKSKKDKKKSGLSTPLDDTEVSAEIVEASPIGLPSPSVHDSELQPEDEWATPASTKKSKKDKKKSKSGLSTSLEDKPSFVASGKVTFKEDVSRDVDTPALVEEVIRGSTPAPEIPLPEVDRIEQEQLATPIDIQEPFMEPKFDAPESLTNALKPQELESLERTLSSENTQDSLSAPEIPLPAADDSELQVLEISTPLESLPPIQETIIEAQPSDDWGTTATKTSKKDKKNKKSGSSTPFDENLPIASENAFTLSEPTQEIVTGAAEPSGDWDTPVLKKSKKDKKGKKSGSSTPFDESLATPEIASMPEQSLDLAIEPLPTEKWDSPASKKSKKDKKGKKSGFSTPYEETPAPSDIVSTMEQSQDIVTEGTFIDNWDTPTSKSKKDKKGKKSGSSTPFEETHIVRENDYAPSESLQEPLVESAPADEWDTSSSKKSKKDKKGKKSSLATPWEDTQAVPESFVTPVEQPQEPLTESKGDDEWDTSLSKNSKKDKKGKKSGFSTPLAESPIVSDSPSIPSEASRDIVLEAEPVAEAVDTWASFETKESKKDKKSKRSGGSTPSEKFSIPLDSAVIPLPSQELPERDPDTSSQPASEFDASSENQAKTSKKDKNKLESNPSTPLKESSTFIEESQADESPAEIPKQETEILSPVIINEPVQEAQDDWETPAKPSKKDKKRKSTLATPSEEIPIEPSLTLESSADLPKQEIESSSPVIPSEHFQEAQAEWALPSKSSKKDKKKKTSGFSTPVKEVSNLIEPEQSVDTEAVSSREVEAPTQSTESEWDLPRKPSKKDKKKKSGLSTPVEESSSQFAIPNTPVNDGVIPQNLDTIDQSATGTDVITVKEPAEEEWGVSKKSSKKEKKKKKSGLSTPAEESVDFIESDKSNQEIDISVSRDLQETVPTIDDPAPEEDWGSISTKKSKKDRKKQHQSGFSTPLDDLATIAEDRQIIPNPQVPASEGLPIERGVSDFLQTEEFPQSQPESTVVESRDEENFSEFALKPSKKDKKKKKSGASTPLDLDPVPESKPVLDSSNSFMKQSNPVDYLELAQTPFTPISEQQPSLDLTDKTKSLPSTAEDSTIAPEGIPEVETEWAPSTKKTKKDKKGKRASRAGSESGPSSAPSLAEAVSKDISQQPDVAFEPESATTVERTVEPENTTLPVYSETLPEILDVASVDLSRKSSKKDKRKRQTTTDSTIAEGSPPTAPITSWANEVEEAEVVRDVPIIEEIAKDESLSHIASTTELASLDDFSRPSKKGKKGKKREFVDLGKSRDARQPLSRSPTKEDSNAGPSGIVPALAATVAAVGAVVASTVLGKPDKGKGKEVVPEVKETPTRKLSKKEKLKKGIDRRTPREDIFDDDELWGGKEPKAHEETKDLVDGGDESDGFWSPPQNDERMEITEEPTEIEQEDLSSTTFDNTTLEQDQVKHSDSPSHMDIDTSANIDQNTREVLVHERPEMIRQPEIVVESPKLDESSRDMSWDPDVIRTSPKFEPAPSPSKSPVATFESPVLERDFQFKDTTAIDRDAFSTPTRVERIITEEAPLDRSPYRPHSSSKFSMAGFSDLPSVVEEDHSTGTEYDQPRSSYNQDLSPNRDSAFVSGSPIPAHRTLASQHEPIRDSGIHLREFSPSERSRKAVSSSDDAIARLSWPAVDEDAESVDLNKSQRLSSATPKKRAGETPKQSGSNASREVFSSQKPKDTKPIDLFASSRSGKHSPDLARHREEPERHGDLHTLQKSKDKGPVNLFPSPQQDRRISDPSKPHTPEVSRRDLLPSQKLQDEPTTDLHRTKTIQGRASRSREDGLVRQRLQRFESPDSQRIDKPKADKYGELGTSQKPPADKSRGFSDTALAGAVIGGVVGAGVIGFAAARQSSLEKRPDSAQSQRSISNINRLRTPDGKLMMRPDSSLSNRSGTPPLRRSDRKSGDLRSLSQRSKPDLAKEAELAALTGSSLSNLSNANPTANEGRVRAKDMADVYDGFGEGHMGSPRSPTRPHSMRRRQSMQVLELESKVEQLAAENRSLADARAQAERSLQSTQHASSAVVEKDAEIDALKRTLDWLQNEVRRLSEMNDGLTSANVTLGNQHNQQYGMLETKHADATRELEEIRNSHNTLSAGMAGMVAAQVVQDKDREITQLRAELESAKETIREMQRQILASKANDVEFLVVRDEDYFDNACQQLCQHVQQWVLRFSKFSDMRACRLTSEISNDKTIDRLDNAILDGSDVDSYLTDRIKRRDVFMSMTMTMVWEFIFTRYLFGMDREQRQKLKSLEKLLLEVGPASAVHHWRATTLTLLSKRDAFVRQREQDTQAVVHAVMETLSEILPPPSQLEEQIETQLKRVIKAAVDLSIEMRTQRAEYMMLPPLQPEYDANGDLASKVSFNAALMNERSGDTVSNEELEDQKAVVRIVLFPLVVKKGDDKGEGDEEIVVCPAQVLVAKSKRVRVMSPGSMVGLNNASRVSMQSTFPMGGTEDI